MDVNDIILLFTRYIILSLALIYGWRKKSLTVWIFIGMYAGICAGMDVPDWVQNSDRFSKIFLNLIKTIVAPLLFATLVVGIAGHSNLRQIGRMGWKALLYFELVTTLALFIGLGAINLTEVGKGIHTSEVGEKITQKGQDILSKREGHDVLVDIFPENIAKAIAENQVLQVVVFSIIFGIALSLTTGKHKTTLLEFSESLSAVMFKFTHLVMYFAPIAVFGALASTVARSGTELLQNLAGLVGTLYGSLIVFVAFVFIPIIYFLKIPFRAFVKAVAEPVSIAFATSTSEAALPKAMENMEKFGVPRKIVAFVLPTGYSFNLDGTTLYLSLASVFVAQMAGIDLTFGEQLNMCIMLMLTSKGVAGVRGASFVILVGTVSSIGISPDKAFVILAVDALMDMARTSVNVVGNCLATVVVAKWENEFTPSQKNTHGD